MAEDDVIQKCRVEVGRILPCSSLFRHIDEKVVRWMRIMEGDRIVKTFLTLHDQSVKKRGVVINYCPFCSTDISGHLQ